MRIRIFAVAFAFLACPWPAGRVGASGAGGALLWCVTGPERLSVSREISLDAAARLCEAGAYGEALEALAGTSDSLRAGIVACYAERYAAAAGFLDRRVDNPYLEWLRRYYRALALHQENRPRAAIVELDSFFVLADELAVQPDGNVGLAARDLAIGIAASADSLWSARGDLVERAAGAGARGRLVLMKAYLDRGLDTLAAEMFREGSPSTAPSSTSELLWEIVGKLHPFLREVPTRELKALASRALSENRLAEAKRLSRLLMEIDDTDKELLVLAARIRLAEGDRKEALDALRGIAASARSPQVRAEAGRRAAELEIRAGDLDSASARYLSLAESTGDPVYYDWAARIELRLGRFDRALAVWKRHDEALEKDRGGPRGSRPSFAAIERVALLHRLARDAEAYEILRESREIEQRDAARRLYWLSELSPADSERAAHAAMLSEEYPASLYAGALEGSFDPPLSSSSGDERYARLERLVAAEWELVDSLARALPPEGWFDRHPARKAYRWALDRGLVAEASEFLIGIERTEVAGAPEALTLHREARERGYHDFSIWIVNRPIARRIAPSARFRLQHPVAYAAILSNGDLAAGLAPELLLAVMYAESRFARAAVSRSGAVGVMQLMPTTARWFSRSRGWSDGYCRDLHDPACNIRIGAHYLAYLLDRADGSLVAALAAYNAGERRMADWKERFDPGADPMAALELISPAETAGYVKNVLEAFRVYRLLADGRLGAP